MALHHEVQVENEAILHFFAGNDRVDQSVIEEELGGLEAGRKFRLRGVFNDAGAGETDHRAGFGEVKVPDAGEAGHDTGVSWMRKNADVRKASFGVIS